MSNITKKTKIILFVGLLVAIILPFSSIETINASKDIAPNENATKKITEKKSKEYTYEKKSNYVKKDLHNYKADIILEKMNPLLVIMPEGNNTTTHSKNNWEMIIEKQKMQTYQKALEKVTKEHKEKIIDKELRKEIKKARQLIIDSGIPTNVVASGIDHLYIQLSKENAQYEEEIIDLIKDVPYLLEYGVGFSRNFCVTTESNCVYEIGGIKIQIKGLFPFLDVTCSLSVPMKKDGVDGFLTAAHCFKFFSQNDLVYQPDTSSESNLLGYSNSTWSSFENDGECDCAWIIDTSSKQQRSGVFAYENAYWSTLNTHIPSLGEPAMLRGVYSNNGQYNWAHLIDFDDVVIDDTWLGLEGKRTINLMSFPAPLQGGDSGGAAFFGNSYIGIVIGGGIINGTLHTIFVPWDHVTENISGLELNLSY